MAGLFVRRCDAHRSYSEHLLLIHLRPTKVMQLQILRSAQDMLQVRHVWERLASREHTTLFQSFDLNWLAARVFAGREAPFIIYARASYGEAIIPAVIREADGGASIRLLGEELFDYRNFLHDGDDEVLRSALIVLADLRQSLDITAFRQADTRALPAEFALSFFTMAPGIRRRQLSGEAFAQMHLRLARNLRRMERLGFDLRLYDGSHLSLVRNIYQRKAEQEEKSLFRDPVRVDFMIQAGQLQPQHFQIFTLERGSDLGAALVTLVDSGVLRFYTCWFSPELAQHSPALALIYEATRLSLEAGMDCDYMTGEQPYKLRLATYSVPLLKLHATHEQLASLSRPHLQELRPTG